MAIVILFHLMPQNNVYEDTFEKSYVVMAVKYDASEYSIVNGFSNTSEQAASPLLPWMSPPY